MKKVALPLGFAALAAGTLLLAGARPAAAFVFTDGVGPATFGISGGILSFDAPVSGGGPTNIGLTGTVTSHSGGFWSFSSALVPGFALGTTDVSLTGGILSIFSPAAFSNGDFFVLTYADPGDSLSAGGLLPPSIPEASSMVSMGALVALGGLALVRRRRIA
jgi:MYXO-CTERM domain-containing protein